MVKRKHVDLHTIGWREWIHLPELGIRRIKAKIDTGACTSSLHAVNVERYRMDYVKFSIHPLQNNKHYTVHCKAKCIDERWVSDSGGHREKRLVILTPAVIGEYEWPIEITLANRETMKFRMLLGRKAMQHHFNIDCAKSYIQGKPA